MKPGPAAAARRARVVVIGGGMAGILSSIKLREAGYNDVTVYEKAGRLGGTWRENTYPGVACDVFSHLYSYSFELNPDWSRQFAGGEEILSYLEDVARRHGVFDDVIFTSEVTTLTYGEGRWRIGLADGREDEATHVIAATGVLHHPSFPDLPGLGDFAGSAFHSARWDHTVALEGARVGIIGTGSTAVQITSALADRVEHLTVFQRTPQWVLPVPNEAIDEDTRAQYRKEPQTLAAVRAEVSRMFEENFANAVVDATSPQVKTLQEVCRLYLESAVSDPTLRQKLRPDYPAGCKRLVISPDFYEKLQRPTVELVTEPISRVEEKGIRTDDGVLHQLDVLVLATGFRVDRFLRPIDVTGKAGAKLDERWAHRPSAYLAISIPDFPNLFLLNGPNGPVGNFSLIEVAELQLSYVLQTMALAEDAAARGICATEEASTDFDDRRVEATQHTVWVTGCKSWYLDDRGVPAVWPWTFDEFRQVMAKPDPAAFDLVT